METLGAKGGEPFLVTHSLSTNEFRNTDTQSRKVVEVFLWPTQSESNWAQSTFLQRLTSTKTFSVGLIYSNNFVRSTDSCLSKCKMSQCIKTYWSVRGFRATSLC